MRPPPACFMTAATARLNVKAAPMLTTKRRSQSASGTSSMRRICCPVTPLALLTSTSTAPPVVRSICAIHAAVYQSLTGRLAAARPGNVGARTLRHCRGGGPVSVTLKHSYTETCEGCGWLPQDIGMLDRRRPTRSGRPGGGNRNGNLIGHAPGGRDRRASFELRCGWIVPSIGSLICERRGFWAPVRARLGSEVCPHAEMCNGVLQRFDETAMSL